MLALYTEYVVLVLYDRKMKCEQVLQTFISKLYSGTVKSIPIRCSRKVTSMHLCIGLATGFHS